MSMTDAQQSSSRWVVPGVAVLIGVAYLVAGLASGDTAFGIGGLALMTGLAAVMAVAARFSETAKGLLDRRDERINAIDRDASLVAGMTVLLAALVMFVVEVARGQDGSPYYHLAALGGVAYVLTLLWYRWRR